MSTNQSRINPAILNFLMRKRQQQGAWDEHLPDNESVGDAVSRIAPYAGDEPKTGSWRDFIQNAPQIDAQPVINRSMGPMSRIAEMPVTDTLQRNYNPETGDMPDILNTIPDNVSLRETRARTATPNIIAASQNATPPTMADQYMSQATPALSSSPIIQAAKNAEPIEGAPDVRNIPPDKIQAAIAPLINAQQNLPLETSAEMGTGQPQLRAAQPYERLANGNIPISPEDTTPRARITDPSQFLINRAIGSLTDQPTYGFDKNGLPRTQAKRGVLGRAGAFGKTIFKDVTEDRPLISSFLDAGHAAANPDIVEKRRLQEQQQQNFRDAAPALAIQREQAQIADIRAQAAQRIQSPLSRDLQARRAAVLRTVATQKHYKRGENPALDDEIDQTKTPIGEFDNRRDPNANKMAIVHEGQTYMVTPKQALDYSMGQDVELSPGNFVRLTPGQQAGYYGQMGGRAQQASEFNVTQQRYAQEHNAGERQKVAESKRRIKAAQDYNANIQKGIDSRTARVLELRQKAKGSASPKEQTELEKEAEHLQETIDDWGTRFKDVEDEYQPNLLDEGSVEVPKAGQVRTSAASSPGGKFYTRAQVQAYADKLFNGDYSKAEANVRAEGYDIQ